MLLRIVALLMLLAITSDANAVGRRRKITYQHQQSQVVRTTLGGGTVVRTRESVSGTSPLAEVNAARLSQGLRPFIEDPALTAAAQAAAAARASRGIVGHLPNDFAYLPPGTFARAAGCGALEPSWGWGTCCTYENYTYAGAGLVIGRDGRRYMHLFVR